MNALLRLRPFAALLVVLLLGACAGTETIRGRLAIDLRPQDKRSIVLHPPLPEVPRYRYLGELLGEPNFEDVSDKTMNPVVNALMWLAGVFEAKNPLLMQRPHHGAVDGQGRILVVDAGRGALLVFDPKAPKEEKSDKGEGQLLEWTAVDGRTRFEGPVAVTQVWQGDIAVSDAKLGLVARLNAKGEPVAKLGVGQLQRPTGLAFDAERGRLYVADTVANDIKVFDEAGKLLKTIGDPGDGPGQLNAPTHLAFADGQLYVSDTLNNRIQIFDADGRRLREFGQSGLYVGNFARPKGVAVDGTGIVYVVESYFGHLLAFTDKSELLLGIKGSGLKEGEFMLPSGVWTDKDGRVFVADMFNGRVVIFQFIGPDGGRAD